MSTSVRWVLAHAIYLMLIVSTLITADAQTKPTPPKPPSENLALGENRIIMYGELTCCSQMAVSVSARFI